MEVWRCVCVCVCVQAHLSSSWWCYAEINKHLCVHVCGVFYMCVHVRL